MHAHMCVHTQMYTFGNHLYFFSSEVYVEIIVYLKFELLVLLLSFFSSLYILIIHLQSYMLQRLPTQQVLDTLLCVPFTDPFSLMLSYQL